MTTAESPPVLFAVEKGVARITLNRPQARNAISRDVHAALAAALDQVESRRDVRAMLLTGAGPAFCAGQDLTERDVERDPPERLSALVGESLGERYNPLALRLRGLPVPWVCAVNGAAAGAGVSLALLADIAIAAESARFTFAFAKIGLMPDVGASAPLPERIGMARALGMALTGEAVSARQAADWGMIWRAVPDAALAEEAEALAGSLAAGPTRALLATRDAIRTAATREFAAQLDLEAAGQRQLAASSDYREGVLAFKAKRKARFTGG